MARMDVQVATGDLSRIHHASVSEFRDTLASQLSDMTLAIEELNATWQGPNHESFVAEYAKRKEGLDAFHGMLAAFLEAWDEASRTYEQCEDAVAGYVK